MLSLGWLSAANAAMPSAPKTGTDSGDNCKSEDKACATIANNYQDGRPAPVRPDQERLPSSSWP
jgi:hypothetical protein